MCGIIGYTGKNSASEIILSGLKKLEYRGYDSAGIATLDNGDFMVAKAVGALCNLTQKTKDGKTLKGFAGIGHNRWATHGEPTIQNAHPHIGNRFAIVHNGIIENEEDLKSKFLNNIQFKSDTDTEVVLHLLEKFACLCSNTEDAIKQLMTEITGSYAIAILDKNTPKTIYALKNKSPLLIGCGDGFNMIGSDVAAMIEHTNSFCEINDGEYAVITDCEYSIFSAGGKKIKRDQFRAHIDASDIQKGAYPHYMLKEIEEQPIVIRRLIKEYSHDDGSLKIDRQITNAMENSDKIYIVACGTSYHAGLVGKFYFENIAKKAADAYIASEFVYNMPTLTTNPLFIFISQSGETADVRAALVKTKQMGCKCITITNSQGSTLSRESDFTLLLHAGPEIAVASTKAYTAQVALLAILSCSANNKNNINICHELAITANVMDSLCLEKEKFKDMAHEFLLNATNSFYIGRVLDYYVALEAALKLKEISYIHTEGFAAGELKHGPIALIEKGTPVIAIVTQENTAPSIRANIKEVKARGASVLCLATDKLAQIDDDIVISNINSLLAPLAAIIPIHFITYYAALEKGCNIDKPKNLAKSVTVE